MSLRVAVLVLTGAFLASISGAVNDPETLWDVSGVLWLLSLLILYAAVKRAFKEGRLGDGE